MKLSKILLSSVVAAAMAFGMLGCGIKDDEHGMIKVKGDTATVDYVNSSNSVNRAFRTLKTKHTDATAVITIDPASKDEKSVFGFIFDVEKDKNVNNAAGTKKLAYDFSAVAVRRSGNQLQAYVSRFENVDKDLLESDKNFLNVDGNNAETQYLKGTKNLDDTYKAYATIAIPASDDLMSVAVVVTANNGADSNTKGSYTVKFYKSEDVDADGKVKDGKSAVTFDGTNKDSSSEDTVTVPASWKGTKSQQFLGFYAASYPNSTNKGSIKLPHILNEDEVIEWDD